MPAVSHGGVGPLADLGRGNTGGEGPWQGEGGDQASHCRSTKGRVGRPSVSEGDARLARVRTTPTFPP
ncbi:MAG: hypothetical protein MZV64_30235 [Ignavibacteriales bacterium]|nr:hypothetical protein [Ignavibacteriales bacterium]